MDEIIRQHGLTEKPVPKVNTAVQVKVKKKSPRPIASTENVRKMKLILFSWKTDQMESTGINAMFY